MGNPFTQFINRANPDDAFNRFVADWDDLEDLLIDVYRRGVADAEDAAAWETISGRLEVSFPAVMDRFEGIGAEVFQEILALGPLINMVGNREFLKKLPDAREKINLVILA